MSLLDVRQVFVVQDRATGAFVDLDMGFVTSLKHAARAASVESVRESMHFALHDGGIECPLGYDIHSFFEASDEWVG
ncbi:hypothetical protein [Dechloromonas hortensis]|uniref:hypothetical protein n=1 Tax=Dechloromonas hortensis TaxID=337779 RepID=UPI001291D4EF|nr:hypothetical protein [Dechloromonas hortensis]